MLVPINWLKDYIDLQVTDPNAIAESVSMIGIEVTEVKGSSESRWDKVIVGQINEIKPHPQADKLVLTKVNIGGEEDKRVVCGATNIREGHRIPVAVVGAVLPGDFKIKKSKIRGEVSEGMLCSSKELGISDDHAGIMILDENTPVGVPLDKALRLADPVLEFTPEPNRPDCLNIIGAARETAVALGLKVKYPEVFVQETGPDVNTLAKVTVDAPDLCPRYTARAVTGVKIGPSPDWMVRRLEQCGIRSINNIVDITNYILLEFGQPMHAFDLNLLADKHIIVRRPNQGEKITTIDETEHNLEGDMCIIADAKAAVAIGGIMGGLSTEINDGTTDVLLESAYFNPRFIRRTSKKLKLSSESSFRFERGVDPETTVRALDQAAKLMAELAGGTVAKGRIDVYPEPVARGKASVRVSRINRVLGIEVTLEQAVEILNRLEFETTVEGEVIHAIAPPYRVDILDEIDLVEEVARVYGYPNIPTSFPAPTEMPRLENNVRRWSAVARDALAACGMYEAINYSFSNKRDLEKCGLSAEDAVPILNPISEEHSLMRPAMLPILLASLQRNINYGISDVRLFEIRKVFWADESTDTGYNETSRLAGVLAGRRVPANWNVSDDPVDFFDAKGAVENLLEKLGLTGIKFEASGDQILHPGVGAEVKCGKESLGILGELNPKWGKEWGFKAPVFVFDLNFEKIADLATDARTYKALPKFPGSSRDIALVLPEEAPAGKALEIIRQTGGDLIESATMFDVYRGENIDAGKKSIAYGIVYRSAERTLTDKEVDKLHSRIVNRLRKELGGELRA
jgi:phenylalanyl-tRNA synthetase beta chain